jgi:hypothetical protein
MIIVNQNVKNKLNNFILHVVLKWCAITLNFAFKNFYILFFLKVQFFEERRAKLTQGKSNRKLMLPENFLHNYLTDFRNNANHNFSSHQTAFPFDDDDDDD